MLMTRSTSLPKDDETNKGHKFDFNTSSANLLNRPKSGLSSRSSTRSLKQLVTTIVNKTTPLLSISSSMLLTSNKSSDSAGNRKSSNLNNLSSSSKCFMTCALSTTFIIIFGVWFMFNIEFFLSHEHWNQFTRVTPRHVPEIGVRAKLPVYFEHAEMNALNEYLELKKIHYIYPTALQSTIEDDDFLASEYFNSAALWDENYCVYWMITRLTSTKQQIVSSRLLLSVYNENFQRIISDQFLPFRPNENNIYGPEDPRLFSLNGEIMFTFQYLDPTQIGVAKLFEIITPIIDEETGKLETIEIPTTFEIGTNSNADTWHQCKYLGLDPNTWQKNWSPFEYKGSLYFMVKFNPLLIIHCGDACKSICHIVYDGKYSVDANSKDSVGLVRGGTQLIQVPNMIIPEQYQPHNNKNYDYLVGILHTTWWEDNNSAKYRGHIVVIRLNFDVLDQNEIEHDEKLKETVRNESISHIVEYTNKFKINKLNKNSHPTNAAKLSVRNNDKNDLNALDNAVNSVQMLADDGSLSQTQIEVINDVFQKLALKNIHKNSKCDEHGNCADHNKKEHIIRVEKRIKNQANALQNAKYRSVRKNDSTTRGNIMKSYNSDNRIIHMTRSFTMKICLDHPLLMGNDPGLDDKPCLPVQFWSLIAFPVSIVRIDPVNDRMWISWGIDDAGSVVLEVQGFLSYLQSGFSAPQGFSDLNTHHTLKHSDSFFGKAHTHSD